MATNNKYSEVLEKLEIMISSMAPHSKLPTFRELMREYSISQSPLDTALKILEEKGIISKIHGSGIYVCPQPGKPQTRTIGLVTGDFSDNFYPVVIRGVEKVIAAAGYRLLLCHSHDDLEKELVTLKSLRGKIDALIIFPYTVRAVNPEYLEYFNKFSRHHRIPIITINVPLNGINSRHVAFDDYNCFQGIPGKLINKYPGAQVFYMGSMGSHTNVLRMSGFKSAISGLNPRNKVIYINSDPEESEPIMLIDAIIQKSAPGKLLFFNAYPTALDPLINFLVRKKINIPKQAIIVSVVEEDYVADENVPIIRLVKPNIEFGEKAGKIALSAIRKGTPSQLDLPMKIPAIIPEKLKSL